MDCLHASSPQISPYTVGHSSMASANHSIKMALTNRVNNHIALVVNTEAIAGVLTPLLCARVLNCPWSLQLCMSTLVLLDQTINCVVLIHLCLI